MEKNILLLGSRKGLILFERRNGDWKFRTLSHAGAAVSYAMIDPRHGTLWCCLDHGHWGAKLQRSDDLGATWQEVDAPKYPEGAVLGATFPGVEPVEPDSKPRPATLKYLWVAQPGNPDQPHRLYLGTEPGGLFYSENGNGQFTLVESLWNHPTRMTSWFGGGRDNPGIHSILIDPRDSRRIWVAISCAGVFETADGGQTWEPRNRGMTNDYLPDPNVEVGHDPHLVAQCRKNPNVMWQQNHCGIFRTVDGARNWTQISGKGGPAHFGFAIAADPEDENTAWVVPAQSDQVRAAYNQAVCVCRTEDGGRNWITLRKG
ncbi:MAG TPA: glycosyl hydrolase, partial [bacterium]|nr:glycosyl hydrolase [bacterium]